MFGLPFLNSSASFGAMLLLGVAASMSSCLASTGGVFLAWSSKATNKKSLIVMHLSRLVTFMIGGGMLGALGGAVPTISPTVYGLVAITLGAVFLTMALSQLGVIPPRFWFTFRIPGLRRPMPKDGVEQVQPTHWYTYPMIGAVSFILPCGFTQTAQGLALASGSIWSGAIMLFAFALGTLPVLAGMSWASGAINKIQLFKTVSALVLLVFAFAQFRASITVFGVDDMIARAFDHGANAGTVATMSNKIQVVDMEVTDFGYSPSRFTLKQNVPVRWEIYTKNVNGCTNTIMSRALNINQRLQIGMNVIEFTPTQTGPIAFSCGMGMVRGSFTVVPDQAI